MIRVLVLGAVNAIVPGCVVYGVYAIGLSQAHNDDTAVAFGVALVLVAPVAASTLVVTSPLARSRSEMSVNGVLAFSSLFVSYIVLGTDAGCVSVFSAVAVGINYFLGDLYLSSAQRRRANVMCGRCARCGYLLKGLPTSRCPECGVDAGRER